MCTGCNLYMLGIGMLIGSFLTFIACYLDGDIKFENDDKPKSPPS